MLASRWFPSVSMLVAGAVLLAATRPNPVAAVILSLILLGLVWFFSPAFFPRPRADAEGRAAAADRQVPLIYWRPGCSYCVRMRLMLGGKGSRAVWVDVSRDSDASARVRSVNDGNETVPTVFIGDDARTNPSPKWVRAQLLAA